MKAIGEAKLRIGVAEVPGTSPKRRLQRSDPFKEKRCKGENCLVCVDGDVGRWRLDGITYKVTCKRCDEVYVGETSACHDVSSSGGASPPPIGSSGRQQQSV